MIDHDGISPTSAPILSNLLDEDQGDARREGHDDFPLFVCSDPTMARENAQDGDRLVTAWWVRTEPVGEPQK
jgi:hypothetical protein